jgi:hypothetical protein
MKTTPKQGDLNFETMREDKTKLPMPTKREYEIGKFYTALKMMKDFKYQLWMNNPDVIGPGRERINSKGEIFVPKFRRSE